MKKLFIKKINRVLAGIMGLFGFTVGLTTGCRVAYGSPYADYIIKGAVLNEARKPIPDIRVGFTPLEWNEEAFGPQLEYYWRSTTFKKTNANGAFTFTSRRGRGNRNNIVPIYAEDIDGEENGLFQPKKIDVDFNGAVQTGKPNGWYEGEFTVTTTIQLVEVE